MSKGRCAVEFLDSPPNKGLSAFELWQRDNPDGTLDQYFASLIGATGPKGADGPDGETPFQAWLELPGNEGKTQTDYIEAIRGPPGDDGETPFQVWLEIPGNEGKTHADYIEAITGPTGDNGEDAGPGKTPFQTWLTIPGNEGKTQEEFKELLNSTASVEIVTVDSADGSTTKTVTVPPNCYSVKIIAVGGGSGGAATITLLSAGSTAVGGGSGATTSVHVPTKPGDVFWVVMGPGGNGAEALSDGGHLAPLSGEDTFVTQYEVEILRAEGGKANSNYNLPGVGGVPGGFDGSTSTPTHSGRGGGVFGAPAIEDGAGNGIDAVKGGGGSGGVSQGGATGGRGGNGFAAFIFYRTIP